MACICVFFGRDCCRQIGLSYVCTYTGCTYTLPRSFACLASVWHKRMSARHE